jgi:hypothetical protein
MKKLFSLLIILFISVHCFSQELEISIPRFDKNGNITETIYTREFPKTYEESKVIIELLLDIYNETNNNYKNQILTYEENSKELLKLLEEARSENAKLADLIKDKNNLEDSIDKIENNNFIKDNFESIGIIAGYGLSKYETNMSIQLGIKFWKLTFGAGPNVIFPNNKLDNTTVGINLSLGIWF